MGPALSIDTDRRRARLAVRYRMVPSARVDRVVPRMPTPTDKALSR